jgi:hypothetical protein
MFIAPKNKKQASGTPKVNAYCCFGGCPSISLFLSIFLLNPNKEI